MPPLCPIGSHPKVQSPKAVTGGLGAFTKVSVCHSVAPGACVVVRYAVHVLGGQ